MTYSDSNTLPPTDILLAATRRQRVRLWCSKCICPTRHGPRNAFARHGTAWLDIWWWAGCVDPRERVSRLGNHKSPSFAALGLRRLSILVVPVGLNSGRLFSLDSSRIPRLLRNGDTRLNACTSSLIHPGVLCRHVSYAQTLADIRNPPLHISSVPYHTTMVRISHRDLVPDLQSTLQ